MIQNQRFLLEDPPIKGMLTKKMSNGDTSYGLSEAGYDIRIKQDIHFRYCDGKMIADDGVWDPREGRFTLASAIEEFQMPENLVGIVHDKSTWARRGLSVFNTVIEPGWKGFLTLELVYHGHEELFIPSGSGIAQVLFHKVMAHAQYDGKYQNQEDRPVESRKST